MQKTKTFFNHVFICAAIVIVLIVLYRTIDNSTDSSTNRSTEQTKATSDANVPKNTERSSVPSTTVTQTSPTIVLDNLGDPRQEGHTPTTFKGSGTGLFIGDNLNEQFPADAGLQAFVTFDLSTVPADSTFEDIQLSSSFARTQGNPLESLGKINVDLVSYESFSPSLWDLQSQQVACIFEKQQNQSFRCSVAEAVTAVRRSGASKISFRLRFDKSADGDGLQDLISFRNYDPNANFPGLFQLTFSTDQETQQEQLTIPMTVHRLVESGSFSTARSTQNILKSLEQAQGLWAPANIVFDTEVIDTILSQDQQDQLQSGDISALQQISQGSPNALQGFFIQSLDGINGIAFGGKYFAVVDETTVYDYRTVAHEIGHLLGLPHTDESIGRLLYQGSDGHILSESEIETARASAKRFK